MLLQHHRAIRRAKEGRPRFSAGKNHFNGNERRRHGLHRGPSGVLLVYQPKERQAVWSSATRGRRCLVGVVGQERYVGESHRQGEEVVSICLVIIFARGKAMPSNVEIFAAVIATI